MVALLVLGGLMGPELRQGGTPSGPSYDRLPVARADPPVPSSVGVARERVTVPGPEPLPGTVFVPSIPGPHLALAFVHGAGTSTGAEFTEQAERLASVSS